MNVIEATVALRNGEVIINRSIGMKYYIDNHDWFRREGLTLETRQHIYNASAEIKFSEDELTSDDFELEDSRIVRHGDIVIDGSGNIYPIYMFSYPEYNVFKILDISDSNNFAKVVASIIKYEDYLYLDDITHGTDNRPIKLTKVTND